MDSMDSKEPAVMAAGTQKAYVRVDIDQRSRHTVDPFITGKFAEHLGWNINNGMCAQILKNPTFADYRYSPERQGPDGQLLGYSTVDDARQRLRGDAQRFGWPQEDAASMADDYGEGLAAFWAKRGDKGLVRVSPDVGRYGGRAQRVEVREGGLGISQWTWLPLHRVRQYRFRLILRSPDISCFTLSLYGKDPGDPVTSQSVEGVSTDWSIYEGALSLPENCRDDSPYLLAVTADSSGQFVISRLLLYPGDYIDGADPEIIGLLKDSKLPLLRWPGGNFVSGYRWEDGIGPQDARPTRQNPAWSGVEPNLFGTDEFIMFCRAVGAEPLICVNAGDGTPEEAARWIEYCNGPADSPMGAVRAGNGHPEPYNVRYWEIGNELWGRWQIEWTTPAGYMDRAERFAKAMIDADPNIELLACGAPMLWDDRWNAALVKGLAALPGNIAAVTDHILVGGNPSTASDPMDIYRDFMAFPAWFEKKYEQLRGDMAEAGIANPRLAITEMQLFAHIGQSSDPDAGRNLTHENLVAPNTQAEALSDILHYHMAVRLAPFVGMITHSAIVNHGGGLRKAREKSWADPCHYAQAMFSNLAGSTPVAVQVACAFEQPPLALPDLKRVWNTGDEVGSVDAIAAVSKSNDELFISVAHRGSGGPVSLEIDMGGSVGDRTAQVITLSADLPWNRNTLEDPAKISPTESAAAVIGGKLSLELRPFSYALVRVGL